MKTSSVTIITQDGFTAYFDAPIIPSPIKPRGQESLITDALERAILRQLHKFNNDGLTEALWTELPNELKNFTAIVHNPDFKRGAFGWNQGKSLVFSGAYKNVWENERGHHAVKLQRMEVER